MKLIRKNFHWIVALLGVTCLVAAGAGLAQRQSEPQPPQARDARDLSTIFRNVCRKALPSIVSIETVGKARQVGAFGAPFGDDEFPFPELFRDHPQFHDFFRRQPEGELPRSRGMGSGFIIDASGIIMTNSHVVRDADKVTVKLNDGREFTATDITTDPRTDVAIVRIKDAKGLVPIPLGNSDTMEIGDWVLAIGSPFELEMSVTAGIISAKGRNRGIADREDFLQTDAAINPGNSGGPLLNLNGEVIGVNTAIASRSGGSDGIGFAITINMAHWVANQLIEHGAVKRAYLGIGIQPIDNDLSKQFNVPVGQGAVVTHVFPESPAADSDLKVGDIVLEVDGKPVQSPRSLQNIVEQLKLEETYRVSILRDGKRVQLRIKVKEMPERYAIDRSETPEVEPQPQPAEKFDNLGLEIQELTPDLARKLGASGVKSVLVGSVQVNSAAHSAGIRTGDIIQKVGPHVVTTPDEFEEALKSASLKDGVLMLVRSQGGTRFVVVKE